MLGDKTKSYPANGNVDAALLARGVEAYLVMQENMASQIIQTPYGYTVQTRKKEDWKKFAMQDQALAIEITEVNNFITVKSGQQKWISKSVVGVAGAFIAWPIGIPMMAVAAAGQVTQISLIKKVMAFIDMFMASGGTNIRIPEPEEIAAAQAGFLGAGAGFGGTQNAMVAPGGYSPFAVTAAKSVCPECGAQVGKDQKFCPTCGAANIPKKTTCPNCGFAIDGKQKFCPECGASTAEPKVVCSSCGAEISKGQKFCFECGSPVGKGTDSGLALGGESD